MADDTPASGVSSDAFVLRSGVRSGLKREFLFAIKAQAEISASVGGRTRSGRIPAHPDPRRTTGKRRKTTTGGDDDEMAGASPDSLLPPPIGETSIPLVDGQDEANAAVVSAVIDKPDVHPVRRLTRAALRVTAKDPARETNPSVGVEAEAPIVIEDDECAAPKAAGSVVEASVLVQESDGPAVQSPITTSKEDTTPLKTPLKVFARSTYKGPLPAVSPPSVQQCVEQVSPLGDQAKGPNMGSNSPEKPNNGAASPLPPVQNAVEQVDLIIDEAKGPNMGSTSNALENLGSGSATNCVQEKPARRFTRSVLKAPVIEQEGSTTEAIPKVNDHGGCKEQPTKRLTRSAIKSLDSPVVRVFETPVGVEAAEMRNGNTAADGPLRTTPEHKTELKISNKIVLTNIPSNITELLATGLLEGFPVKYKHVGLEGVVLGSNILCSCSSCKGSKMISPDQFELHACGTKKNPSDFIFLENGNSIYDVLKACSSASFNTLETVIQNAIGTMPSKKAHVCQKCKEKFHTSRTGKFALSCDSCLEVKQPETDLCPSDQTCSNAKLSTTTKEPDPSDRSSKNKINSLGKLTKKDLGLHKFVFMGDILPEGTEVSYYHHGKKLLDGHIKDSGIYCTCCGTVVSPSQFEAHAGRASRRKPYHNIYTSNGVSLHELSVSLSKGRKLSTCENDDLCRICADGGNLILCDLCPRAFHKECVGLSSVPEGDWYCQYCQNMHQREKFVENNDNALAAGRVAGVDPIEQIIKRCIRIVTAPGTNYGGCSLCRCQDFSTGKFDGRTVLICDQCEKEYHVGCLKDHDMADLQDLPEDEWFCCTDCNRIHVALHKLLLCEPQPLEDHEAGIIKRKQEEKSLIKDTADVRWRLLSGKSTVADSKLFLSEAVSILEESFDPIIDVTTGRNLISFMVNGENMGVQDFGGMYCMVLTVNSSVVSSGVLRILGSEVAELPLVATSRDWQGQGYFQSMFSCIERLLESLNVKHFVLPAADEALSIWTKKFGFTKIPSGELSEYTKGANPMIFQGTSMLHKLVPCRQVPS